MKEADLTERSNSAPCTPCTDSARALNGCTLKTRNKGRRVNFPADDLIVSGYFDAPDPWNHGRSPEPESALKAYQSACERSGVKPLESLTTQLEEIEGAAENEEKNLSLRGVKLDPVQCEPLEEIFKRVQFKKVDLDSCQLDDEAAAALFDMVEYYDSANRLTIMSNKNIDCLGWQACSRMVKKSPSLQHLDVRNTSLSEHTLLILGRALRLSTHLVTLHLENCSLSGRPLVILAASLKLNTSLKELFIGENKLGASDGQQIGNLIRENIHIHHLDLANNNLQDGGIRHLAEGCQHQPQIPGFGLRSLVLRSNHVTHSGAPALASLLVSCRSLENLDLSHNSLTNEGVHKIKQTLMGNRTLRSLNLANCKLSCEGAIALAEYVADNKTLTSLDLRGNEIRVAGIMALALSLRRHNTHLRELHLNSVPYPTGFLFTRLDETEVQSYQEQLGEIAAYLERNRTAPKHTPAPVPPPVLPTRAMKTRFTVSRVYLESDQEYAAEIPAAQVKLSTPTSGPSSLSKGTVKDIPGNTDPYQENESNVSATVSSSTPAKPTSTAAPKVQSINPSATPYPNAESGDSFSLALNENSTLINGHSDISYKASSQDINHKEVSSQPSNESHLLPSVNNISCNASRSELSDQRETEEKSEVLNSSSLQENQMSPEKDKKNDTSGKANFQEPSQPKVNADNFINCSLNLLNISPADQISYADEDEDDDEQQSSPTFIMEVGSGPRMQDAQEELLKHSEKLKSLCSALQLPSQITVLVNNNNNSPGFDLQDLIPEEEVFLNEVDASPPPAQTFALLVPQLTTTTVSRRQSSPSAESAYFGHPHPSQPPSKLFRLCKHLESLDLKSSVPLSPSHLMDTWGFTETPVSHLQTGTRP